MQNEMLAPPPPPPIALSSDANRAENILVSVTTKHDDPSSGPRLGSRSHPLSLVIELSSLEHLVYGYALQHRLETRDEIFTTLVSICDGHSNDLKMRLEKCYNGTELGQLASNSVHGSIYQNRRAEMDSLGLSNVFNLSSQVLLEQQLTVMKQALEQQTSWHDSSDETSLTMPFLQLDNNISIQVDPLYQPVLKNGIFNESSSCKDFKSATITKLWKTVASDTCAAISLRNKAAPSNNRPGFFGESTVHVLQLAYDDQPTSDAILQWSIQARYNHHFVKICKDECVSTIKVKLIDDLLRAIPVNDWVIFVDANVTTNKKDPQALDSFLTKIHTQSTTANCELVAMSAPHHAVHTGVLILRATMSTRNNVSRWLEVDLLQKKQTKWCHPNHVALQNIILEQLVVPSSSFRADGHHACFQHDPHEANLCFREVMEQHHGHDGNKRYFDNVCLVECHDGLSCFPECGLLQENVGCDDSTSIFRNDPPITLQKATSSPLLGSHDNPLSLVVQLSAANPMQLIRNGFAIQQLLLTRHDIVTKLVLLKTEKKWDRVAQQMTDCYGSTSELLTQLVLQAVTEQDLPRQQLETLGISNLFTISPPRQKVSVLSVRQGIERKVHMMRPLLKHATWRIESNITLPFLYIEKNVQLDTSFPSSAFEVPFNVSAKSPRCTALSVMNNKSPLPNGVQADACATTEPRRKANSTRGTDVEPLLQQKSYTKPMKSFFGEAKVHVLQVADEAYAEKMEKHTKYNMQWVEQANYEYHFLELDRCEHECLYTIKVKLIDDFLRSVSMNDWVIFLDLDAHFAYKNDPYMLDRFLTKTLKKADKQNTTRCELVALSAAHTVNTGVMVLRSTEWTRDIISTWLDFQKRKGHCAYAADQVAMQNVLLEKVFARGFNADGYHACFQDDQHTANLCFMEVMEEHSFPRGERYSDRACLVGCRDGLQCFSDCLFRKGECNPTKTIFHHNKEPLGPLRTSY